jgi:SSS family solute:Na+ symporter
MFFALTGAIYTGGAGAVIIGGLYWKRGTTAGAFTALFLGALLAVGSMVLQQQWKELQPWLAAHSGTGALHNYFAAHAAKCPLNGQMLALLTTLGAVSGYVVASLLTCREPFNLERMLHRGQYALADGTAPVPPRAGFRLSRLIGFDHNFTTRDKWVAGSVFWYGMAWFAFILIGTIWNFLRPWPLAWWINFWHWYVIILPLFITIVTTLWLSVGAVLDLRRLFRDLAALKRDSHDDGTVVDHHP